jgi:methylmalonyl-CoA mutase cobalamin-binding subunit
MGFDRAFPPGTSIDMTLGDLRGDLEARRWEIIC